MVNLLRGVLVRVALIVGVAGLAYLIGQKQRTTAVPPVSVSRKSAQKGLTATRDATGFDWSSKTKYGKNPILGNDDFMLLICRDPKAGLAELAKLPRGPDAQATYSWVFAVWAGDPKQAAEAANAAYALPDGYERRQALLGVAGGWANSNAPAALDWASSLPPADSAAFKKALIDVASDHQQPQLAAQYVDKLQDASARNQAIIAIARAWGIGERGDGFDADPTAALDWLDKEATGITYDNSVTSILSILAKHNPGDVAALIDKVNEPGVRGAAIANLAKTWGETDPSATLAWIQTLPDTDATLRVTAANSVITAWASRDPYALMQWATGLPPGSERDTAVNAAQSAGPPKP